MRQTSLLALERHESSGNAETNRQRVLSLVQENEGSTSREIYEASSFRFGQMMDLTEVRRRLTDLANENRVHTGPKRRCRIRGNLQMTWLYGRDPNEKETE